MRKKLELLSIASEVSVGPQTHRTLNIYTMKPLIKKHKVNPKDLVNYRPTSNLPFQSKILEKVVS